MVRYMRGGGGGESVGYQRGLVRWRLPLVLLLLRLCELTIQ